MPTTQLPADWRDWPDEAKLRLKWRLEARPPQLTPGSPGAQLAYTTWNIWLILSGRGWGKTRVGAEDAAWYGQSNPGARIAVVAPSFGDVRDTCIEGESGLLRCLPSSAVEAYNRSHAEIRLHNGSRYKGFSSEEPERLRGPQHHRAWCDELAAWEYPQDTWDMLLFGLRLGTRPQVIATTTPKPIPLVRDLVSRGKEDPNDVCLTLGNTFENAANLAPAALNELRRQYEGTRIGRQELYAELLDDAEGALWSHALLDSTRIVDRRYFPEKEDLLRVVVGVDPAVTSGEYADATGIVVAATGYCRWCGNPPDPHVFVLEDASVKNASPETWAKIVSRMYDKHRADRVVPEINNGGEMVTLTLKMHDRNMNVRPVHATRGKQLRAEPVAALYEQGRVHHLGALPELEDEMCTWEPENPNAPRSLSTKRTSSPDRLDALVWSVWDLMMLSKTARRTDRLRDVRLVGRR